MNILSPLALFIVFCLANGQFDTHVARCGDIDYKSQGYHTYSDEDLGKCYMLVEVTKSWRDASQFCSNFPGPSGEIGGGELIYFDSHLEYFNIQQWLEIIRFSGDGIWIGVRRCSWPEVKYCKGNGSEMQNTDIRFQWAPGQPDSKSWAWFIDNICIQLDGHFSFQASTAFCGLLGMLTQQSFICQFPMMPKTTTAPSTTTTDGPQFIDSDIRVVKSLNSNSGSIVEILRNLLFPDSVDGDSRTSTTTTTVPGDGDNNDNGELSGSSMLVIGIVIGFVITFITAVVFAVIFRKKYQIQSIPTAPDDKQISSSNPCSVSTISDGQVEIGDVALRQNASNQMLVSKSPKKLSVNKSGRGSAISTLPPPYAS